MNNQDKRAVEGMARCGIEFIRGSSILITTWGRDCVK